VTRAGVVLGDDAAELDRHLVEVAGELRQTPLFETVRCALEGRAWSEGSVVHRFLTERAHPIELATLLVLACPREVFTRLPPNLRASLEEIRTPDERTPRVQAELRYLATQMKALQESCCEPA